MEYLTDRKRAVGLGSARAGTRHHWRMTVGAVALTILVPLFVFTFGRVLGADHAEVVAHYSRPWPAIIAGLTLIVGLHHFKDGARIAIEDYSRGVARKVLLIATTCVSYAAIAVGLFALARLAL